MRLGLNVGYWSSTAANPARAQAWLDVAVEAERLGYSCVWVAEAYGSDAATVLGYLAARTSTIDLGAAVFQIPARTPAMTAMTAATLDTLTGGRFRLGLGVSGPVVSEGWHGVRFDAPLERTREYVEIVRRALRREKLRYSGRHYTLPLPDGPGKPLHLQLRPPRAELPVYLAAIGPRNLELTGEIADGWLPVFFSPEHAGEQVRHLRAGADAAGRPLTGPGGFDIAPSVPVVVGPDWRKCADAVRGYAALYLGGMGSREKNFYNAHARRMGFEREADEVQRLYLERNYQAAMQAIPVEFLDATSLLGPVDRIADRLQAYADAGVGTLNVLPFPAGGGSGSLDAVATLRAAAEACDKAGVS
ncbi:LLM class F420-dependent oxidoreductase [Thermocrispum sp.]|uniref:LLM class F420-dependent oxidoreductase n=1 Tax=Thermocrispum sp. TaxID=2060768 RepID=UPI00257D8DFC|nr:LLM class F420-dependent oxidoreductase [Thermocrispum sp.]